MLQEYISILHKYVYQIGNQKRTVLLGLFFICVFGWAISLLLPNVYRSEAKLYVDPRSMLDYLLEGITIDNTNMEADLLEIARVRLLSNNNLRKVAEQNDMLLDVSGPEDIQRRLDEIAARVQVQARNTTRVRGTAQEITLAYEHKDPERAKSIVNSLLNSFIESVLGGTSEDSKRSVEFIDSQITTYEERLDAAENNLKQFRTENFDIMPEEGRSFFGELQRLNTEIQDLGLKLRELQLARDGLQKQYDGLNIGSSETSNASAGQIASRIALLEGQLDELLLRFTDKHPDVVSAREQLRTLRRAYSKAPVTATRSSGTDLLVTELGLEISRADAEIASVRARLEDFTRRRDALKARTAAIPEIEARLRKLSRDYDVYKNQYETLLQRRESARISRNAEVSDSKVQFQVIEAPYLLPNPVAPNRLLLISLVFVLAWAAVLGFVILKEMLSPTFYSSEELGKSISLPVLGSVTYTRAEHGILNSRSFGALVAPVAISTLAYAAIASFLLIRSTS
jgi:polysaccharide chain length determinant protein (PEP-CTERM system associated)